MSAMNEVKKTSQRNLNSKVKIIISIYAVIGVALHLYSLFYAYITPQLHSSMHLLFTLSLVFLLYKPKRELKRDKDIIDKIPLYDKIFSLLSFVIPLYIFIDWQQFIRRSAFPNQLDIIFGFILIILLLEATRRIIGLVLPIIAISFSAYAFFGFLIPGPLGHRGTSILRYISGQFMTLDGVFSAPLQVSSRMIFMFILFGAFLTVSGAGDILIKMANSIAGRTRGGPGKIAVVASSLMGMVSGSASANTATTGQFTIPLMKKTGFTPQLAGAIEAVASTGGTMMPPIMGAGAFIMADILGISYLEIVKAAILPSVLFYVSVYVMVHLEAIKIGLKGLPDNEIPKLLPLLKKGAHILIPIVVLIWLVFSHYPILRSALYSIFVLILVSQIQKTSRFGFKKIYKALEIGMYNMLPLAMCCATAGIVIGSINLTGLGPKFSILLTTIAGSNLILALVVSAIITLILGMGLPATAAYIVAAVITAPALMRLGFTPIGSHLFAFYYACLAQITPPIALAAYIGAAIAGSDPFKTAMTAVRLGIVALIVPFMFIRNPALILQGDLGQIALSSITALVGVIGLGIGLTGYFNKKVPILFRVMLIVGGIFLMEPGEFTNIAGLILIILPLILMMFVTKISGDPVDASKS